MKWLTGWVSSVVSVSAANLATAGLFGAVGLILAFGAYATVRPMPKAPAVVIPASTTSAEGVAVVCVRAWLTAPAEGDPALRPCFPTPETRTVNTTPPPSIGAVTAVASAEVTPGYWSVTVAAEVLPTVPATVPATPDPEAPGLGVTTTVTGSTTRYYRVGIRSDGKDHYTAAALPEPTSTPTGGPRPNLLVGRLERPQTNDPVVNTVSHYLSALLAGDGELSRYVWPGTTIRPVTPAPYVHVELREIASVETDKLRKEVVATAAATDADGRVQIVAVSVEVARRVGRWEVTKTLPAPSLAAVQPDAATAPTAAPSATAAPTTTTTRPTAQTTTRPRQGAPNP